ncbi:hypothetical protein [Streptosporangium sp. NPDC051022]|uniref:hypothetical protein n=1 Tax=Streptosporangium sp. NPDC051022 TaxID=3155752 RepID=UPI0034435263
MSRSTQIHRLARDLSRVSGVPVEAVYDDRNQWSLNWNNGPATGRMKTYLVPLAQRAGLETDLLRLRRTVQDDALAVQAVRHLRTTRPGEDRYAYEAAVAWQIDQAVDATDHPDRPLDEREAALAARLLTAEGGYTHSRSLAERLLRRGGGGLAAFLEDDLEEARPGDRTWAAEYLTARYATGEHRAAWERHLQPMPAQEALAAAAADPDPGLAVHQAALTLAPVVRAELEAALADLDGVELALISGLREQEVAWARIGQALGTTRQGAAQRAERLAARTTPTVSTQR